jgi:parallel beta-helix repeat protein
MGKANHTIYSKAITHSRFILLSVHDARVSGIELQYGWCNTVEDSSFNGNQIGVSVSNSANNFVAIDSWFEGNGIGIVLLGSAQARIVGNVIEGNRAAGLVVTGVRGLTISGNYFEGNCQNLTNSPATLTLETASHGQYLLNADIVLNGAAAVTQLAPTYPTYSAIIEGSYHSPFPNGSAIAAVAVEGLIVRANSCGLCQNVSLLDVGTSASWSVADVSMEANTGAMCCRALVWPCLCVPD